MLTTEATMADWLQLLRAEYLEIPGLQLTKTQVGRFWGLDPTVCDALIEALVDANVLKRTRSGAYVRVDAGR